MDKLGRILLQNALECLNRLYDGDSTVIDVYSTLFATAVAFSGSGLKSDFDAALPQLLEIVRSSISPTDKKLKAIDATDDLRGAIATELSRDAAENPRQRHRP